MKVPAKYQCDRCGKDIPSGFIVAYRGYRIETDQRGNCGCSVNHTCEACHKEFKKFINDRTVEGRENKLYSFSMGSSISINQAEKDNLPHLCQSNGYVFAKSKNKALEKLKKGDPRYFEHYGYVRVEDADVIYVNNH